MERIKSNTFQLLGTVAERIIDTLSGAEAGKFNKHPRRLGDEAHLPLIGEAGTPDIQAYSITSEAMTKFKKPIAITHSLNDISTIGQAPH